ncbi:thermonuclease family protein [Labrys portucalensis]|uniref:Thermonuclease family protein n=1 Tax=Labrys neptuniae TaxID=376174 RepID=A0ABV6ZJU1_9HYPH
MPPRTDVVDGYELRIIDGDTVAVGDVRLRIENIDAPEIGHASCWYEKQLGQASADILADFIIGQRITIRYLGPIDRYNRPKVRLLNSAGDIGEQMVKARAALPWAYGAKAKAWRKAQWCEG